MASSPGALRLVQRSDPGQACVNSPLNVNISGVSTSRAEPKGLVLMNSQLAVQRECVRRGSDGRSVQV